MPPIIPTARLPLLDKLLSLDAKIRLGFEAHKPWFEQAGLRLTGMSFNTELGCPQFPHWANPKNCAVLGDTGYEAVHYNILIRDGLVDEHSPVFVTVPHAGARDAANYVVGESFESFIRFGLIRGFFGMYQLAEDIELTLEVYSSPDWQPTKEWHHGVGFVPDEEQKSVLEFIGKALNLTPISYTPAQYQKMQERFLPNLEYWDYDI